MSGRAGQDRARVKYSVAVAVAPTHYRVSRFIVVISVCVVYSQLYPHGLMPLAGEG